MRRCYNWDLNGDAKNATGLVDDEICSDLQTVSDSEILESAKIQSETGTIE